MTYTVDVQVYISHYWEKRYWVNSFFRSASWTKNTMKGAVKLVRNLVGVSNSISIHIWSCSIDFLLPDRYPQNFWGASFIKFTNVVPKKWSRAVFIFCFNVSVREDMTSAFLRFPLRFLDNVLLRCIISLVIQGFWCFFFTIFGTYLWRHFPVICLKAFHNVVMSPSVSKSLKFKSRVSIIASSSAAAKLKTSLPSWLFFTGQKLVVRGGQKFHRKR